MSLRKRIIINVGSNWANTMVAGIVQLLLVPIILSSLGVKNYGVWALLAYGLSYPIILERAFALSINRFVAFYRDDVNALNRFVSASFVILTALAFLTVITAAFLSFFISDIFAAVPAELAANAQVTCILVGVTLACMMLESSFSGALKGYQYYTRSNIVTIIASFLRMILTVSFLAIWKNMIMVQLAFLIAAAISAILMFAVAKRSIPGLTVKIRLVNKEVMKQLWRYTSHSIARSGSSVAMYNTLLLLVGWKGNAVDVAIYNIAFRIPNFVRGFLASMQNVFLPAVTSLYASGQIDVIKVVVKKGIRVSCVLTCSTLILLFVFAREILVFWIGDAASQETVFVMRLLIISVVPGGVFEIWLPVLVGMEYLRALTVSAILATVSTILLALALLQSSISVPVVPAVAMLVVLWVKTGFWLPSYGLCKLKIHSYEFFKDSLRQPLIASVISIAVLWVLSNFMNKEGIHWAVMFAVSAVIVAINFVVISLRREVTDLIVGLKRKFISTTLES